MSEPRYVVSYHFSVKDIKTKQAVRVSTKTLPDHPQTYEDIEARLKDSLQSFIEEDLPSIKGEQVS